MKSLLKDLLDHLESVKQRALALHAYELFRRHGFQRVSVEEICQRARVSKVTFYKYFANKDELILFITRILFDDLLRRSSEVMDSDAPIREKLAAISQLKQDVFAELGDELMQSIMKHPAASAYFQEIYQVSDRLFRNHLKAEQQKGVINPNIKVELIMLITQEINRLYGENRLAGLYAKPEEMIRQINDLLWNGLLAREQS